MVAERQGSVSKKPRKGAHGGTRKLRPWQVILLVVITLLVIAWRALRFALPGHAGTEALPAPRETALPNAVVRADFVGAARCASCHGAEYAAWKRSTHERARRVRHGVSRASFGHHLS